MLLRFIRRLPDHLRRGFTAAGETEQQRKKCRGQGANELFPLNHVFPFTARVTHYIP
jgi:hypothetical protein